ncbi:MAG: hypothetical protein CSA24_01430 [Deltaproteobacteria bacterium]|nr:MAG: hypothetical protein CSB49_07970 [Pseudomonadota bacterium]PIE65961.1 MAG: hypothetical protein CSA24_01430 [Deltaproteobacteria bacterium]
MDAKQLLSELETLAEKLDVDVRYDRFTGDGARSGGLCKIRGRWRVILERRAADTEKLSVLARCLSRFDLPDGQEVSTEATALLRRSSGKVSESSESGEASEPRLDPNAAEAESAER